MPEIFSSELADGKDWKEVVRDGLPAVGEHVWVECLDFWVLAYLDEHRVWREVADGEELRVRVRAGAEVPGVGAAAEVAGARGVDRL